MKIKQYNRRKKACWLLQTLALIIQCIATILFFVTLAKMMGDMPLNEGITQIKYEITGIVLSVITNMLTDWIVHRIKPTSQEHKK